MTCLLFITRLVIFSQRLKTDCDIVFYMLTIISLRWDHVNSRISSCRAGGQRPAKFNDPIKDADAKGLSMGLGAGIERIWLVKPSDLQADVNNVAPVQTGVDSAAPPDPL